jgi:hypothetical protein
MLVLVPMLVASRLQTGASIGLDECSAVVVRVRVTAR